MASTLLLAQAAGLLAWYNAVFVVLFGVGFLFTLLQLIGMGHGSDADADTDVDAHADLDTHVDVDTDADVDVDAHVDVDADADVDAHVDVDADADADVHADVDGEADTDAVGTPGHGLGVGGAMAQLLGIGKVPLSISLMLLCYTMGVTGWLGNELLGGRMSPGQFFPLSLLAALVAAFLVLRFVSMFMARYIPTLSTTALHKRQLVGLTAKAVLPVNERFGQATLYDKFGTLHVVGCKVRDGAKDIEKGADVVLIKYMPERDLYIVGRA